MNIVVLMLDSLRPDHVGCYGNEEVKTPHLDRLAREGTIFTRAYAEYPITVPSRTALVSGDFTFTNRPWCPLRGYDLHIAEILKEQGYVTAAFSDTPFSTGAGMDRGFDTFEFFAMGKCHKPIVEGRTADISDAYFPPGTPEVEVNYYRNTATNRQYCMEEFGAYCPELITRAVEGWLDDHRRDTFLLWVDHFNPHEPWDPPPPYDRMYQPDYDGRYIPMPVGPDCSWMTEEDRQHVLANYKGCVTETDEHVGRVIGRLRQLDLLDDTLVVVISDHGEPFCEHGTIRKYGVPVYDELSRMVFMLRKPGLVWEGLVCDALVENTDLLPTVADMLDIGLPRRVDGLSLSPLLRGEADSIRDKAYMGGFNLRSAVRTDEWKFIDHRGERPNELFDMNDDPAEKRNLAERQPTLVKELHRDLWEFHRKWSHMLSWRDEQ
ncbi:MAG: sulfatase [Armatimonadota bacterium]